MVVNNNQCSVPVKKCRGLPALKCYTQLRLSVYTIYSMVTTEQYRGRVRLVHSAYHRILCAYQLLREIRAPDASLSVTLIKYFVVYAVRVVIVVMVHQSFVGQRRSSRTDKVTDSKVNTQSRVCIIIIRFMSEKIKIRTTPPNSTLNKCGADKLFCQMQLEFKSG